ncbi:MAG: hypothetical protein DMG77_16805 [Acidobacteria bacterium]|nr:MAG: hypothetical protein DMG77_16805 [Acidobacteriota bacterium]
MIAYLRAEEGGALVRDILLDPAHDCLAHAINLCEVYYDFFRSAGETMEWTPFLRQPVNL